MIYRYTHMKNIMKLRLLPSWIVKVLSRVWQTKTTHSMHLLNLLSMFRDFVIVLPAFFRAVFIIASQRLSTKEFVSCNEGRSKRKKANWLRMNQHPTAGASKCKEYNEMIWMQPCQNNTKTPPTCRGVVVNDHMQSSETPSMPRMSGMSNDVSSKHLRISLFLDLPFATWKCKMCKVDFAQPLQRLMLLPHPQFLQQSSNAKKNNKLSH